MEGKNRVRARRAAAVAVVGGTLITGSLMGATSANAATASKPSVLTNVTPAGHAHPLLSEPNGCCGNDGCTCG